MRFILATIFLIFGSCAALAADKYASPTGSGTTCTEPSPCALSYLLNQSYSGGDNIILLDGTYRGMNVSNVSGAVGNNVTIKPKNRGAVTLDINQTFVLASPIPATGGGSFSITQAVNVPGGGTPFKVKIDNEELQIIATSATTFDIYFRAQNGTSEAAHSAGAIVYGNEPVLQLNGSDVTVRDLVITNTSTVLDPRPTGIYHSAPRSKIINNVIYNTGLGIFSPEVSTNSEIYGNLLYNNGGNGAFGYYGIGLYIQNGVGTKTVSQNVMFGAWGESIQMQAYSSGDALIENLTYTGNVIYDGRFIVGGDEPSTNITLNQNYFYLADLEMGYGFSPNVDGELTNNYVAGKTHGLIAKYWQQFTASNNKFYRRVSDGGAQNVVIESDGATPLSGYIFTANEYATNAQNWYVNPGNIYTWAQWQALGKDTAGGFRAGGMTGVDSFYLQNAYEAGRSLAVFYNWSGNATVQIDLSQTGLSLGQGYTVRNALNWDAGAISTGTYTAGAGSTVTVTVSSLSISQRVSGSGLTNANPQPTFAAFLVQQTTAAVTCRHFFSSCG